MALIETESGVDSISSLVFYTLFTISFAVFIHYLYYRYIKFGAVNGLPGPTAYPIVGNGIETSRGPHEFYRLVTGKYSDYPGGASRIWIGPIPFVLLYSETPVEKILTSLKYIDKSEEYVALQPWLGTGLLTSTGRKWQTRRKMLTPTFHFKILEDFLKVFNIQSAKFITKIQPLATGKPFDIFIPIGLCALDIILESAMGRSINAQDNAESDYVQAVHKMGRMIILKQTTPWIRPNFLFKLLGYKREQDKLVKILHSLSLETIRQKRKEYRENKEKKINKLTEAEEDIGVRRRLALLDLLLEHSEEKSALSDDDIREEVDTFMFEGHDTTSAGINWTIYLLGLHPELQAKVHEELDGIFGDDRDRETTPDDLRAMKYLECCVKESLRIFPSVPFIARELHENLEINGQVLPIGTTVFIVIHKMNKDPKHFPDPHAFKPERFFPENAAKRHPFAYVPFSAGPRNCIGQRFAMSEEKTVLSTFFRHFRVESCEKYEDMKSTGDLILRPENGTFVKVYPRKK